MDEKMVLNQYQKDISGITDYDDYGGSGAWRDEITTPIDAHTLKSLFKSELWVYRCVDTLAQALSSIPLLVAKTKIVNGKKIYEPAEGHPLQKVLNQPNEFQSGPEFVYNMGVEFFLAGNAIAWFAKGIRQFIPLATEGFFVTLDPKKGITYRYSPNFVNTTPFEFKQGDLLHVRRVDPSCIYWGLSPFIPGNRSVQFSHYSGEYLNMYYQRGAKPQLVIESDATQAKVLLEFMTMFESKFGGRKNQRRPLVLPKGYTAKELDNSIADQSLINLIRSNREELINILGVPKQAVSLQESGSLGSEEHRIALRYMYLSQVIPASQKISASMNEYLKEELTGGYEIYFDIENLEALAENLKEKASTAKEMLYTKTINEVRNDIWNLPPIPGGDVVWTTQAGILQVPAIANPSAPIAPKPALQEPQQTQSLPDQTIDLVDEKTKAQNEFADSYIEKNKESFDTHFKALDDVMASKEEPMQKFAYNILGMFIDKSIEIMKETLQVKATRQERVLRRKLEDAFDEMESQWVDQYETELASSVETGYGAQLGLIMNEQDRNAVQAVQERDAANRRLILKERAIDSFAKISKTTTDGIMNKIEEGLANNTPINELIKTVAMELPEQYANRAATIARTETLTAVSIGQNAAMQNAAKVIPNLQKMWITGNDERVRGNPNGKYPNSNANHYKLHGEVKNHDEPFSNGLMLPRALGGSASEVINCRCSLATFHPDDREFIPISKH